MLLHPCCFLVAHLSHIKYIVFINITLYFEINALYLCYIYINNLIDNSTLNILLGKH